MQRHAEAACDIGTPLTCNAFAMLMASKGVQLKNMASKGVQLKNSL